MMHLSIRDWNDLKCRMTHHDYVPKLTPLVRLILEPRSEKTGLRGFRPGSTQTGLYCDRKWLEA